MIAKVMFSRSCVRHEEPFPHVYQFHWRSRSSTPTMVPWHGAYWYDVPMMWSHVGLHIVDPTVADFLGICQPPSSQAHYSFLRLSKCWLVELCRKIDEISTLSYARIFHSHVLIFDLGIREETRINCWSVLTRVMYAVGSLRLLWNTTNSIRRSPSYVINCSTALLSPSREGDESII